VPSRHVTIVGSLIVVPRIVVTLAAWLLGIAFATIRCGVVSAAPASPSSAAAAHRDDFVIVLVIVIEFRFDGPPAGFGGFFFESLVLTAVGTAAATAPATPPAGCFVVVSRVTFGRSPGAGRFDFVGFVRIVTTHRGLFAPLFEFAFPVVSHPLALASAATATAGTLRAASARFAGRRLCFIGRIGGAAA
jgi:hypothetical protein